MFNTGSGLSWLAASVAVTLVACGPGGGTQSGGTRTDSVTPAAAPPTAEALLALDRQANEAYFRGDGRFFEALLRDSLVMQQGGSRLGKADLIRMINGVRCDVGEGWSLTQPQLSRIDDDTYALSYVATVEGRCTADGRTEAALSPVRASTVWARAGQTWQVVFHGEDLIVDPMAAPAADNRGEPTKDGAAAAKPARSREPAARRTSAGRRSSPPPSTSGTATPGSGRSASIRPGDVRSATG